MENLDRLFTVLFLGLLLLALTPPSIALAQDSPDTLYVRCGKIIVDASKPAIGPADLVVNNGKITAIGSSVPAPANARQLVEGLVVNYLDITTLESCKALAMNG